SSYTYNANRYNQTKKNYYHSYHVHTNDHRLRRSTPINHHRISSNSWYNSSSATNSSGSGDNQSISQHPTCGAGPTTPTRNLYSAVVVHPDTSNSAPAASPASTPSTLNSTAAAGIVGPALLPTSNIERIRNNNSYDKLSLRKTQKSRSSDSESPSDGGLHHQPQHHHISHHSRHTSPISSANHVHHHHHHHHLGQNHNHFGAATSSSHSTQQHTHISRSDRSNSRSRSRSPSSSCSSTNSTTTSQSNETSSTTRSPATLVPGGCNSSAPFGSGREVRSDRLDREQICNRGSLQSAVTVSSGNNNGGSSSGASSSSGSGGGNLNCHSEDNRPLAICVRNLPARSSDTSLKDGLFHEYKKHGKVTWVKVVGQSTDRYALVCFKKPEDVEKALEVSHDKLFFGCKIEVAPYQGYDVDDNEFRPYEAELDEYHPKSTRTLFIGNLEKDITAGELRKHFDCFGEIIEIDIKKQGVSAYAFCQYSDIVSVVKAMRKMDGEHLGSNRIKLGFGKSMPTNCVWIDGISDSVGEGYLESQFDHFGAVSRVNIDRERKLALVFFEQVQCAQVAVKEMRGATLRGRKLQVDFASRECQDAFFDKLDKQTNPSFGSPRFDSGTSGRYSNSRYVEGSSRSRAASFSRPSNPLSLSGAVSPRLDPSPVSSNRGGGVGSNSSTRSRIVRYSNDDYYLDGANSTHSNERRFRNYDEYSQGSAASSHEDSYEHDGGYNSSHTRSSAHDRLQPPPTSDSPPPIVASSGLSSSIQSRLGEVEPLVGVARKRNEKSPGDIRYLQKERVHILEQLEECPSSGDELVSPKKRIKYNSDAHHSSDPSDHHHPHYSSDGVNDTACSSACDSAVMASAGGNGGGGHHHYGSSSSSGNHYNSHHQHHHHNSSENCVQSGFSSSAVAHHRKCVEVRRLSDCNLQQSKTLSSQSTPSSMHSNNNSRRPSTDSTTLHQRHGSSSSNSSSSLQQSHLDSGHPYPHSLSKRRKTILNSDNSMTVIASAGASTVSSNEHHHSSRGRGHQLHSLHSHEASGGESADGSRPGTPLCDERPENLPPSEPRRIPTSRTYNQEPLSLPLPRFAIQFLQQYRLQNQSQLQSSTTSSSTSMVAVSTHSSTNALLGSSLQQAFSSSSSFPAVPGSSVQSQSALSSLSSASSSAAISGSTLHASNSSLLNNTLSSTPPMHPSKLSLVIPPSLGSGNNTATENTQASTSCATNTLEHGDQAPASPLRAPSVSSNSSDSDGGPSISPSLEERINRLDEMYEKWSGNSQTRLNNATSDHHFGERHHNHALYLHNHIGSGATSGSLNQSPVSNVSSSSTSSFRHKFLELDVHEVPPSDIVKSVLSRKSIFDEDLKRLENISDKYEPGVFTSYTKNTVNFNATGLVSSATVSPVNTILASQSPLHALKAQTPPATSLQRLGSSSTSGSPMNSPQPYNSPNPSVKSSLQYPFPSHPPTMPSVAVTASAPMGAAHTTLSVTSPVTTNAVTTLTGSTAGTITTSHCPSNTPFTVSSSPSHIFTSATSNSVTSVPINSWAIASSSHSGTTAPTTTLCRSNSAILTNKPKTNVLNKSISLTEKASTNISSNNNNNLTCNSNNLTSTSSSCNTSINESSATVATTNTIATTTSITTLKVSSTISSSSSSTLPIEVTTVATDATSVAQQTDSLVSTGASSSINSTATPRLQPSSASNSNNPKNAIHTTAPPGSTNSGTIRSNNIPTISTNTSTEGVQQHSSNSNTNNNGSNSSTSNSEKEDRHSSNGSSGTKHHKDRRKLSTASSCSTSSTGSFTPTTSSNHSLLLESKPCETSLKDESHSQCHHQPSLPVSGNPGGTYNKQVKSNHLHSHRHSSDSSSSISSNTTSGVSSKGGHNRNGSDDANEFDRLKLEVSVNNVNLKSGCLSRKEKDVQDREASDKECTVQESHLSREKEDLKRALEHKGKEHEEQRRKHKEDNERNEQEERSKPTEKEHKSLKERDEREKADREKRDREKMRLHYESPLETLDSESNISTRNACDELVNHLQKERRDTVSSGGSSSPVRNSSKRRLSSQDSNDSPMEEPNALKKHKQDNHESDHIPVRKDSGKEGKKEKHHKSYSRSEKSCKSFGITSVQSEKSVPQANVLSSTGKNDNLDEKQQFILEERRKEIVFSTEEQMQQSHHHKKKDRYHEKHKSKKERDAFRDKENTQNVNFTVEHFADHRSTSDEEEHARVHHKKERKSSKDYSKRYHSESGIDYKKYDRKLSRAESSADEEGKRKKSQSNNRIKPINNSSDTDDSDEPKKHSIFDIPDEGPNISMYDKVKARSCKNMQKQEEEKKIKAKFSKLKQSRAKREGKNRSKSWDEDSDTDGMNSDTTINSKYNSKDQHNKSGITTSDDEEHLPTTPRIRRQTKDHLLTDSEEEHSRIRSNRDRLNNLCDDESSEGDQSHKRAPHTPRRSSSEKKASRKNSRSTRIQSDTDSEDNGSLSRRKHSAHGDREAEYHNAVEDDSKSHTSVQNIDSLIIKQEIKSEEDITQEELGAKVAVKVETKVQPPSALITSDVSDDDVVKSVVKSEFIPSTMIKKELVVEVSPYTNKCLEQLCDSVSSENEPTTGTVTDADKKNAINTAVDQLIYDHSDAKKKHKKKQKRHKTMECSEGDMKGEKVQSPADSSGLISEISKRNNDEQIYASSKKKHSGKKDKRRDRTKEEYEKSSKSKRSKNKHKEGSKVTELATGNTKREDKMEDIFGPISDEESQHSSVETESSVKHESIDEKASIKEESKQQERGAGENELTVKEKAKEESRRRRERKRREREKIRAEMTMKEEENSVDLDEAGRALEAQLMSDSDQKADDASPTSTTATSGKRSSVDVMDVFRFTDGDDSMETSFSEKKESDHNRREKKKKKKRGKDEKHKHHHNSGGSSNHSNPPTTTPFTPTNSKLSLDIISAQQEDSKHNLSKQSPSLPCLLEDSPPCINRQSALPTSVQISSGHLSPTTPIGHEIACSTPTKQIDAESISSTNEDSHLARHPDINSSQQMRKSEKMIPGFREIDQQLHEKAVQSISGEFITEKTEKDDPKISDVDSSLKEKSEDSKVEEKSRAVISQEETEDAVAALLGESFGTSNTPDFSIDYSLDPVEESSSQLNADPAQIPEEDDEEMKKAILSLNTEEHIKLDMKPDTPQSEHDLQIDTDTDDAVDEEHPASLPRFDNPPKTPDVDLSQIGKPFSDAGNTVSAPNSAKKEDKLEMPDTPGKNVPIGNLAPPTASKENATVSTVIAKVTHTTTEATALKTTVTVTKPTVSLQAPIIVQSQKIPTSSSIVTGKDVYNKTAPAVASTTKSPTIFTSAASSIQSKSISSVSQKPALVGVQPGQAQTPPQIRHQYIMQAPPTINIPEQHTVYHTMDTVMSPRGPNVSDPRVHSPKLQIQPNTPFMRTTSPTATSPNVLRPQSMPNRKSPQLSPVLSSHPMIIHQTSGHILMSSTSPNNQFANKTGQMTQSTHTGARLPIGTQVKTVPSTQKTNDQVLAKQNISSFSMAPGTRIVTTMTNTASTLPIIGNEITGTAGSGVKISVPPATMPVTTYVIHNTKTLESGQKPGTSAKTIIHQQPVYIQHAVKQFVPQQPLSIVQAQTGANIQSVRQITPPIVSTTASNVIVARQKEDNKIQNSISTITSNPSVHPEISADVSTTLESPTRMQVKDSQLASEQPKPAADDQIAVPREAKSNSASATSVTDEGKALPESMLTEENVAKIPDNSSGSNVLGIDQEDQEGDSKEDSDYWSSKDTIIDSVIKKVDALCSEDDASEGGSELNKEDWTNREDKSKVSSVNSGSNISGENVVDAAKPDETHNNAQVSKLDEPPELKQSPMSSSTADKSANASMVSKSTRSSESDTTSAAEEHSIDQLTLENVVQDISARGGKRGGRRGGRKVSESMATPAKPPLVEKTPETEVSSVSKRGGKTGAKRGRGGGRGGSNRGGPAPVQSSITPDGKGKTSNSGSDVYEFHDDSGEEVASGDKQATDTRPRLIMTIKNQPPVSTVATTGNLGTAPVTSTAPLISTAVSSATTINILANPQLQPTTSCPATQPPVEVQSIPAPATDSSKEEFVHPLGNTRKSRRLLEKDGRTTVDDIIEDVIRNGPSLGVTSHPVSAVPQQSQTSVSQQFQQQAAMPASGPAGTILPPQQPPLPSTGDDFSAQSAARRHTRHMTPTVNVPITDARKSPRAGRKGKDRKISESSVDSNDEKSTGPMVRPMQIDAKVDEKSVAGTLTATTPITPSVPVTRPNETASLADKMMTKEKSKSSEEFKPDMNPIAPSTNSLTLIDPVTGELTVMRTGKEGQYVPMANAPQPLKKVIAAAVNAQNVADQLKSTTSSPTPPISASASPIPNRVPTPGTVPSPGITRVPTPNTTVAPHPHQPLETHKISTSMVVKQSSPLPLTSQSSTIPATTVVIPSPHTSATGTVVIQQGLSNVQPQTVVQHGSAKPHTLKAHVLSSQQQMMQQQQQQQQAPSNKPYQQSTSQQPQIVYKSIPVQQPGAIHTTTGKQIHPSTNIKLPSQQGMHSQAAPPQQIIIQNTIPQQQQQMTINKHTLINKQPQQQQQPHQTAIHHPPGSGNLLINIPQNMHQLGNVPISPRLPQHHQVVIAGTKPGQTGPPVVMQQTQAPHSSQVINKQQTPIQSGQQSGTQQIIIHSAKIPSGHQQLPAGYTTVLQTGGKIIHQGPIQLGPQQLGQGSIQQQSISVPGKHATQTIQISGPSTGGGIPLHYQNPPGPQQPTIVHKTITTVHSNHQQVKLQQHTHHKVGAPETLVHMQPSGHLSGKTMVQHNVPGKLTSQPQQLASQNQPLGLGKVNHVISTPPVSSGNQQPPQQQPSQLLTIQQQQGGKGIGSSHLHQTTQILTGAVASPPLKQSHMQSQQPIVAGASSGRVAIPSISPQGQQQSGQTPQSQLGSHLRHVQQSGLNVSSQVAYEANPHGDLIGFIARGQSPPPAHQQQSSPITPTDATFRGGMPRDYVKYMYGRSNIHIPSRSPLLPGSAEQRELSEIEETVAASPPLELRRPSSGPRPLTTAVPHSLQSPGDRSTDSPQVAQVYIGSARIPHTYSDSLNTRFYDPVAGGPNAPPRSLSAEPPPAHRPHNLSTSSGGFPAGSYPGTPSQTPPPPSPANLSQQQVQQQQLQQRDMQQQRDRVPVQGHTPITPISAGPLPAHTGGITAVLSQPTSAAAGRGKGQIATPPIGGPVAAPTQSDSLEALLQRYPVMWQGLLALKNDQAAVQMHFVHGNPGVAGSSLPSNSDGTTPPLRIAQRMRLEPAQIDGVARKMQVDQEHCMLLALPCGRDRMDVVQQQNNLQTGFITYLQQKQAAGIVNIAAPGSSQAAYVVHIFPSCEFANENLARIAPDLMHRVANIQYLLIVIATV
ncbi:protein split ends, partial [Wyeomyia smithii]|uniref:protein split ends n=1 Tax=Wyeomyia smithii TaxID=174621 RepID=UPI0024680637